MNAIETHGLSRRFGRVEALRSLDLAVPEGTVYALLGPNGAGKTTTIRLLMNLLDPTAGSARVLGVDARHLGPREWARIGYVADGMELPDWMTLRAFLDYCRPLYPAWDRDLEKSLLTRFELPTAQKLKHFSRGMRIKAALLAALAYRPTLLVLDEPFGGLDPLVREDFVRGVLEVSALGDWTVFLSSHDIEEVERLADWVAVLDHGEQRLAEPLDDLQKRFRRIVVTHSASAPTVPQPSADWLEYAHEGALVRFVESRYVAGETEARVREIFPGATITVRPLPLREIYLALARGTQSSAENSASREAIR
jgi:ABC-2 type transport system ATP-binding protein